MSRVHKVLAPVSQPEPPESFSDSELEAWDAACSSLRSLGLLSRADAATIVTLAVNLSNLLEAQELVRSEGVVVEGYRGSRVKNPALQVVSTSSAAVVNASKSLGLTPAARMSLTASTEHDFDSEDDSEEAQAWRRRQARFAD